MNASGGDTHNYLLIGLLNGFTYNIHIVATSQHISTARGSTVNAILGENCSTYRLS